jgi:GTPase Era involved in 16S rRNA processing
MTQSSIKKTDVLIAVIGVTGVGKSTFVNKAAGANLNVGSTLSSCKFDSTQAKLPQTDPNSGTQSI